MSHYQENAFIRGFLARAESLGLEKSAFVQPILGGIMRHFAAPILSSELTSRGLGALAKRQGAIGRNALKLQQKLQASPGLNTAYMIGTDMALSPFISKVTEPIADLIDPAAAQQGNPNMPCNQNYA